MELEKFDILFDSIFFSHRGTLSTESVPGPALRVSKRALWLRVCARNVSLVYVYVRAYACIYTCTRELPQPFPGI